MALLAGLAGVLVMPDPGVAPRGGIGLPAGGIEWGNTESVRAPADWDVYFSPNGGAREAIVAEIGKAKKSVKVLAYSFTCDAIGTALREAHIRGVDVELVQDAGSIEAPGSEARKLAYFGIAVYSDNVHAIQHQKVMVIDSRVLIFGSYNFSEAAEERNSEWLGVVPDKRLAATFTREFERHKAHAKPSQK